MKLLFFILLKIAFLTNQRLNQCFSKALYPESCNNINEISKETAICIQKYYNRKINCFNECKLETEEDNRTLNKSKSFYEIKCKLDKILSRKNEYIFTKKIIEQNINLLNDLKLSITNQNINIEKYFNDNEIKKIKKKFTEVKKKIKNPFLTDDFTKKIMYGLIFTLFFVIFRLIINEIQFFLKQLT